MQRRLMAFLRNEAHAQVESARGAGGGPHSVREPRARPRSPPRGALNRLFTILCMLHIYKPPPFRGWGGTPQRVPIYSLPFGPEVGGQGRSDGGRQGQKGRRRTQTCGVGWGTVSPETRGASAAKAEVGPGRYIQRRVEQINKAIRERGEAGAGQEGAVEKGQAGLRRSQLKMQVCGGWVFWSQGPKRGGTTQREEELGGGSGSSALWRGRRVETSEDLQTK